MLPPHLLTLLLLITRNPLPTLRIRSNDRRRSLTNTFSYSLIKKICLCAFAVEDVIDLFETQASRLGVTEVDDGDERDV
jgi:hypothetical protein